jgi:AraC-like DNA-binding protein
MACQKTSIHNPISMLQPPVTIPIALVLGMLSGLQARGQAVDGFLVDAGIAPALLGQANARVTADQYVALFTLLIERLDDDCIGLLARPLKRGSFAMMARAGVSAPTLAVAIRRIAHSFRLLQDELVLEPVAQGALAGVSLRFCDPALARPVFLHELLLRGIWRLLAWLVGGQLPAARFDFAFERPPHADSYGKVFPAPAHFGMPQSTLWFDAARLGDAVRRDEAALRAFVAVSLSQVIVPRRGDDGMSARVRSRLQQTQPAWPDLVATAKALHVSASTMQRHLAGEGTSFQALKDELRRDLAIARLNTSRVPLASLADELGFANSAAFQRAFKCWTGSAPGAYRRRGV